MQIIQLRLESIRKTAEKRRASSDARSKPNLLTKDPIQNAPVNLQIHFDPVLQLEIGGLPVYRKSPLIREDLRHAGFAASHGLSRSCRFGIITPREKRSSIKTHSETTKKEKQ